MRCRNRCVALELSVCVSPPSGTREAEEHWREDHSRDVVPQVRRQIDASSTRESCHRFTNEVAFPPFRQLPREGLSHHRQWCLLGEIIDVDTAGIRVRCTLSDSKRCVFRLHVHITERSSTLRLADLVPGHTLAVVCAERHVFLDGTDGVRQESADTAYIFRARLGDLMVESARVAAGKRCFHCGGEAAKQCAKCGLAHYCTKECQVKHWSAVHGSLCPQMVVLHNLVHAEFAESPCRHPIGFTGFARQTAHDVHRRGGHLPRPCGCGFQGTELGHGDECSRPGLGNHLDFPPACCLPQRGSVSERFYYDESGSPSRHWAVVAEVREVSTSALEARTIFGETLCITSDGAWRDVERGHCILGLYATSDGVHDGRVSVSVIKRHVLLVLTKGGLDKLHNEAAALVELLCEDRPALARPVMPRGSTAWMCGLLMLQGEGAMRLSDGPRGPRTLWDERELGLWAEAFVAGLSSLQQADADLRALLADHPSGLTGSRLPVAFEERHGHRLDPKTLGFKSWRQLLEDCPGVVVQREAGKDMVIHLKRKSIEPRGHSRASPAHLVLAPSLARKRLAPSDIFFTHDSIRKTFTDGRRLLDTLQLRDRTIDVSNIPRMQVCWQKDRFWTYTGNRRLWVFRTLQEEGVVGEIEVQVVNRTVPPERMTTKNGGKSVRLRR